MSTQSSATPPEVRSVARVIVYSILTLGIYSVFHWYYVNRDLADYGRAHGTSELGTNPRNSVLAVMPGIIVIVPAVWTAITTFKRVQAAQRLAGKQPIEGWIGVALLLVLWPAYSGYIQSGMNSVSREAGLEPVAQAA
jgi:uncharacterized protein DUF4234